MRNTKKAFTLIELLVVISVISLISSVLMVSVKKAASKARDVRRTADIQQIAKALLLYKEKYNKFPCHWVYYDSYSNPNFLKPLLDDKLLAKQPRDPLPNDPNFHYDYMTFHAPSTSTVCGQYALLAFYSETPPAICPLSGKWSASDQHCHVMLPEPLPAPCQNPWFLDDRREDPGDLGCTTWADTNADW